MNYLQGDIVIIPFPFGDLSNAKPRPAIVVSNSTVNSTQDVILAQITSTLRSDNFSFALNDSDLSHSLQIDSEVRCHKLFTAEKSIIKKKISSLKTSNKRKELYQKITSFLEA